MGVLEGKIGEGVVRNWPANELVFPLRGSYVCVNFGENRSRNATVRVSTDGHTDTLTYTLTDANRFHNLSHAICYSYGTDNKSRKYPESANLRHE